MLATLLRLLGIDLQQQVSRLKLHVEEIAGEASSRIERQILQISITLGIALAGLLAALATVAIGLTAIFIWVDRQHGPLVGLAVVGVITAVLAGLMFTLAATRARTDALPKPAEASAPPSPNLGAAVPPPPGEVDALEAFLHRMATHAASAGDEAVETATEFVRSGSREALVGTLALAVLVGILIGRKK
jgi:predicted RND superfamily exporter protein